METLKALDFLAIRGLATDGEECFVGIGPTTATAPGDIAVAVTVQAEKSPDPPPISDISTNTDIGEAVWMAQNIILNRQSDYLRSLGNDYAAKWESTPAKLRDSTVKETMVERFLQWLAGNVAEYFWGPVAGDLAALGIALIAVAIRTLQALYSEGVALCNAMIEENNALAALEASRENYALRSSIISQHDLSIQNLIAKIGDSEKQVYTSIELKEINETLKMMQAEEHVIECPLTGHCIYTKSLVADLKGK